MSTRLVLDFPDALYARIMDQLPAKKPEYAKAYVFDSLNKSLNNIEARQRKTASKGLSRSAST